MAAGARWRKGLGGRGRRLALAIALPLLARPCLAALRRGGRGSSGDQRSHGEPPAPAGEHVDCGTAAAGASLVLLTSSGLGSWDASNTLVPSSNLTEAFRDLVLRLPDAAWESGGASKKQQARSRDLVALAADNFREPELYGDLDVVVVEDNCFLKESFWNEADPRFQIASGIGLNYKSADVATRVELARPFFGGLNGGWCVNFATDKPGYLGGLGFSRERIRHVSLWDALASDDLKTAIFSLSTSGKAKDMEHIHEAKASGAKAEAVTELLRSADIVVVNGGNPDFGKFVLTNFAAQVFKPVLDKLHSGSSVYMGQSAGSMVAAADVGLTLSPPWLLDALLHGDTSGMRLAGRCAIRPHDDGDLWDLASALYGEVKGLTVVRLPDANALRCIGGACEVVGSEGKLVTSVFAGPGDLRVRRLLDAFRLHAKHRV